MADKIAGTVTDSGGNTLQGVAVYIIPWDLDSADIYRTETDSNGEFSIPEVYPKGESRWTAVAIDRSAGEISVEKFESLPVEIVSGPQAQDLTGANNIWSVETADSNYDGKVDIVETNDEVYVAGDGGDTRARALSDGSVVWDTGSTYSGNVGSVYSDGDRVVTAYESGPRVFDTADGSLLYEDTSFSNDCGGAAIDGVEVFYAINGTGVYSYSTDTENELWSNTDVNPDSDWYTQGLTINQDYVIAVEDDSTLVQMDKSDGSVVRRIDTSSVMGLVAKDGAVFVSDTGGSVKKIALLAEDTVWSVSNHSDDTFIGYNDGGVISSIDDGGDGYFRILDAVDGSTIYEETDYYSYGKGMSISDNYMTFWVSNEIWTFELTY